MRKHDAVAKYRIIGGSLFFLVQITIFSPNIRHIRTQIDTPKANEYVSGIGLDWIELAFGCFALNYMLIIIVIIAPRQLI